jgi:hypothetical protein
MVALRSGAGLIFLVVYGFFCLRQGLRTQDRGNTIAGAVCLALSAMIVWAGATGRLDP